MRIISTINNSIHNSKYSILRGKKFILYFCLAIFIFISGCAQDNSVEQARGYISESENYYNRAVNIYKDLISKGKDTSRLHFELGKIYLDYAEFDRAIDEFQQSDLLSAKKFLAISLYRSNNFTDAFEIFEKTKIRDDEYLYYYGLTCEKLNLFDKALKIYSEIKQKKFRELAIVRIDTIEKQAGVRYIKDIDPEIHQIILESPSEEDYPQAGSLILLCDEKIELTKDSQTSYLHYVIKILNERGKEGFSESQIEYDSTFEKVKLQFARTIKPDGTVVDVGSRHIRDVSKYLNFPLYSNVRVHIISFPEITEGAVIEYSLKIDRNQLINKKDFIVSYPVQFHEPIISANFTIDTPEEKSLHIKNLNVEYNNFSAELKPNIEKVDGRLIYQWQFRDIPQIIPESNMPPGAEVNPSMLISTFNSWQEVYDWWWGLAEDKIKASPEIKKKVQELIKDKKSDEEKMRAIYNFCAKEIRYVAVEYGHAGHEPHKAELIFRNKYGDCKDQSILLVTMLREAGFNAFAVLIPTKSYYNLNKDFPSIHFNHAIAAVLLNAEMIFLDPTAETCSFQDLPPSDQDRGVLVFKDDEYALLNTPLFAASHNSSRQRLNIKINPDETIRVDKEILTFGMYDQGQRYRFLYTPPQLIEEALEEAIQGVSIGATLKNYNIENLDDLNQPVVLSYKFSGPEYLIQAGNLRIMPQLSGVDVSSVAKKERRYPIDFGVLSEDETLITYELPENLAVKYTPETVIEDSPWLKFTVEYSHQGNKLQFTEKTELNKHFIHREEYPEFKAFLENLAKKVKQRVILQETK